MTQRSIQSQSAPHEATPGRPRDPLVEPRALSAALEIYGQYGWAGFTMGRVTEISRVGKSSIYRRWPSRRALLTAAFERVAVLFELDDSQLEALPFPERLLTMLQHRLHTYSTPAGIAIIRLHVEHHVEPETVGVVWQRTLGRFHNGMRVMLSDAQRLGQLGPHADPQYLADAVEGSLIMRTLGTNPSASTASHDATEVAYQIVEQIVGPWLTDHDLGPYLAHLELADLVR